MIRGVRIEQEQAEQIMQDTSHDGSKYGMTREQIVNVIAAVMASIFVFVGVPLLIFPPVTKPALYLRPWDDNIEEVYKAAIKVAEFSTRANWETENVTNEADKLAKMRRWDDTLEYKENISEEEEIRPWDDYDFYDESARYNEEDENVRRWDDKVLEKVDQDWSVFDRIKNKANLLFNDIGNILERGSVEEPPEDLNPYFKKEINIGKDILEKSKKGK
jgi:sortase A